MKAKAHLFLLAIMFFLAPIANANANQEEIEPDFLDFLAEMEEITGDGFDNWLATDSESDSYTDREEHYDKQIDTKSN